MLEQQQELEKINSELDKFVYSTAHDLRSPIASSLGLLNLCEQDTEGKAISVYLPLLRQSIEKLDNFINDIGDLSKNARVDLSFEQVTPSACVKQAFELIRMSVLEKKLIQENEWELQAPLYTDRERLQTIFNNLISNAIRFSKSSNDEIVVSVRGKVEKTLCTFTVEDNGLGIPREHIDKIFNMFYRAHDTKAGSGLGLYIVKETVVKLGGNIKVESETRNGTKFTVTIPNQTPLA